MNEDILCQNEPGGIIPGPDVKIQSQGKIAKALAAAQLEMHNPAFDSDNPYFRSKYASLAAIRNACIPVLAKHGIALVQYLSANGKDVLCETRLIHESGESIVGPALTLPAGKTDAQGIGSACTYARRYSMQSVCGLVGDADDDGNAACEPQKKNKPDTAGSKKQLEEAGERFGAAPETPVKEETVVLGIERITKKKVGEEYVYSLYSEEKTFTTNVEAFASFAKTAKENGLKVEIKHHNGVISNLEVLDENTEAQANHEALQ